MMSDPNREEVVKRFNLKDMLIGFLLGALLFVGMAMGGQGERTETFCSMLDLGKDHYYIMTTEAIYHVKIRHDKVIDTSRVGKIGDLKRDVVIRY